LNSYTGEIEAYREDRLHLRVIVLAWKACGLDGSW
jgi:hypothetical protein